MKLLSLSKIVAFVCILVYANDSIGVNFHFSNYSDTDIVIIAESNPLLIINFDTLKNSTITIDTLVEEPIFFVIVFNNEFNGYVNLNEFILHSGSYDVFINVAERKIDYVNSIINTQNQEVGKVYNSLRQPIMKYVNQLKTEEDVIKVNKIERILSEHNIFERNYMYRWFLNHTDYYRALVFVNSYSKIISNQRIKKRKLTKLFNRLNPSLQQFQLYKETKSLLKIYSNKNKKPTVPIVKSVL